MEIGREEKNTSREKVKNEEKVEQSYEERETITGKRRRVKGKWEGSKVK